MDLPNAEIARRVRQRMKQKGMTLVTCCDAFNSTFSEEIDANATRPLNKDFLSRVARNNFKVCSPRISKLCEFLDIHEGTGSQGALQVLSDQVRQFREHAANDVQFRKRYSAIERFLSGLNLQRLLDEY